MACLFRISVVFIALTCGFQGVLAAPVSSTGDAQAFAEARENGRLAAEGFRRSFNFVRGWLRYADPRTGLLPRNLDWQVYRESYKKGGIDTWNAGDAAADNYSFMVLSSSYTDPEAFSGPMMQILQAETRLTSRVASLPDDYSFSKQGFAHAEPNMNRIMFGSSEYIKDGLLAIAEWLGPDTPWFGRLLELLDDAWLHAEVGTPYGDIVSDNVEVNGEMLQVLSRVYWITKEPTYLEWAIRLGDYYLLGDRHPTRHFSSLRLRDHGSEIISGLSELYVTLHFVDSPKKAVYEKPIHEMLDRILEVGRNADGFFYNTVDPRRGAPRDRGLADTWGYVLNAYYSVYLVDRTERYRQAVLKTLSNLGQYRNFDWERGSMDGYADAIEGALNLFNRERVASVDDWLDSEIRVLWGYQKSDGVIEGWHCDGNFARTSLMYSLWKTQGLVLRPWRQDLAWGAVHGDDGLYITVSAERDWNGKMVFDVPRHERFMGLPLDWPRINQLPEWYTVSQETVYVLEFRKDGNTVRYSGSELSEGVDLSLSAGEELQIVVR